MQKSPYAGVINTLVRSESEVGREESRASVCYVRWGKKGIMTMKWHCRSWGEGKENSTFSGLSLVFPATYPVKSLKTGGEKALRHNVLAGNSPFPREKIAEVELNERQ
ncbi:MULTISPECIES: hypothetical protein [Enterobacteriaceae]|uniref:hypothetical protein n=1 Tax=Enterobacteriaceae TaxID=543 RepID=UPI001E3BFD81|nr:MULTISPECIES: hypothetical protein [Enterobacteriaceae]MCM7567769.1 hypothetical protein [Enterobacter asburiae]